MSDFWNDEKDGEGNMDHPAPEQEVPAQEAPAQEAPMEEIFSGASETTEVSEAVPEPMEDISSGVGPERVETAAEPVEAVPAEIVDPVPEPIAPQQPERPALEQPAPPYPQVQPLEQTAQAQPALYPPYPTQEPYGAPPQWNGQSYPAYPQYQQPYQPQPQVQPAPMGAAYPPYPQQPMAQGAQAYPAQAYQQAAPAVAPGTAPAAAPAAAYPAYPAYYGQQAQAPAPAKKKMRTGLKVFLWIAGLLAVAAVVGMVVYFVNQAMNSSGADRDPFFGYSDPFDGYGDYDKFFGGGQDDGDEEDGQDEDGGIVGRKDFDDEEDDLPDVDVTPNTDGITIHQKPTGDTLDAEAVYKRVVTSTVTVSASLTQAGRTGESTGTGIIATSDGYIITNSHVVLNSKATKVTVTTYNGLEYDAVVVGVDRTTDLAVLKTNDYDFVPAEFGDVGELSVGEWVLAIGNPGGARFSSSLTRGIISGLDREVGKYSEEGMTYIQTDAAINPGNSGGPLVNMYGQVVGINSSKIITEGYEGMGFAIPVSRAQPIINELLSGGYVKGRTRLGIMCREIDSDMAEYYGVPRGLQITEIQPDSSFGDTEAQAGDIITAIEGETVESLQDVSNLLLRYAPGDQITVTLYRPGNSFGQQGTEIDVEITLLADEGETQN